MKSGRLPLRLAVLLVVLTIGDLSLDRMLLSDGRFLGRFVAPFDPPLFSPSQFQALKRLEETIETEDRATKFDPHLGWSNKPDSGFGEFRYDWAGARMGRKALDREKSAGARRVVAVGCSMTHGEEVSAEEAWCSRVDEARADLEVVNLGVAAYGIDQALLRLRRDGWSVGPDEVWLGVLPQAALRITTSFRPLLDHWSLDVAFKPRLALVEGELTLLPCPARNRAEVASLLHDQVAFLEAVRGDPWVEQAPLAYSPRGSSWLHASFAGRLLLTAWESRGRDNKQCFDESFESGRIYTAIVRSMSRECAARGVGFRVVILPGESDLRARSASGKGYWEDWSRGLEREGMAVFDSSEILGRQAIEGLFAIGGHYTPAANALLSQSLCDEL